MMKKDGGRAACGRPPDECRGLFIDWDFNFWRLLRRLRTGSLDCAIDQVPLYRRRRLPGSTAATSFLTHRIFAESLSVDVWPWISVGAVVVARWLHKKLFGLQQDVISFHWAMCWAGGDGRPRHDHARYLRHSFDRIRDHSVRHLLPRSSRSILG